MSSRIPFVNLNSKRHPKVNHGRIHLMSAIITDKLNNYKTPMKNLKFIIALLAILVIHSSHAQDKSGDEILQNLVDAISALPPETSAPPSPPPQPNSGEPVPSVNAKDAVAKTRPPKGSEWVPQGASKNSGMNNKGLRVELISAIMLALYIFFSLV